MKKITFAIMGIMSLTALGNEVQQPALIQQNGYQGNTFFLSTTLSSVDNDGTGTRSNWKTEYKGPGIRPNSGILPLFLEGGDAIYGFDVIPNITKQTFDILENNNEVILSNVILKGEKLEVGEYSTTFGMNYSYANSSSYDNVSGYNTDIYSVYFGIDGQVHDRVRLGVVGSFGHSDSDFKNNKSTREDTFFQGNGYLDYQNDENLRFISMLFFGKTNTNLVRKYNATLFDNKAPDKRGKNINETANSQMDNYYFGLSNLIIKRYEVEKYKTSFYYEPRFQFNMSYMMQDNINESTTSSDFDGLSLDSNDSYSMVTSFGFAVGKDFILKNRKNLNFELSTTLYIELGDPYSDLTNSSNFKDRRPLNPLSDDETGSKNTIKGYDADYITLELALRSHYDITSLLSIYSGIAYSTGDKGRQTEIIGDLGINYKF